MADHTVELEAKLNTQQAEQKLNQLNAKAEKTVAGPSGDASGALDQLGDSLKNLQRAVGGGLLASSLGNLAKQMGIFGDQTAQIVGQMQGSMQRLATAAATANPALVGLVGAIEALSMIATISAGADKLVQQKVKGKFVNKGDWDANEAGLSQYYSSKEMRQTLASGSKENIMSLLGRRLVDQSNAQTTVESLRDSGKKQEFAEALKNLEKLDLEIESLQQKLKQLNDEELRAKQKEAEEARRLEKEKAEEAKRLEKEKAEAAAKAAAEVKRLEERRISQQQDLEKARSDWRYSENFSEARRAKNVTWLRDSMNEAAKTMRTAKTASEFREAWTRYGSARSALQGIDEEGRKTDEENRKTEIERLQGLLASMQASPVSNYSAAGFSMGEQLGTEENISRNVELIVRQLQQMLNKQLQTFNLGQGTI